MPDIDSTLPPPGSVAVILPAAGSGQRFGANHNKLLATLRGMPLWYHSAARLRGRVEVGRLVMPVAVSDRSIFLGEQRELVDGLGLEVIVGGADRSDSVRAGIAAVDGDEAIRFLAIHDAARPLVSDRDLSAVFSAAARTGSAILATPVAGTVKRSESSPTADSTWEITRTVDRRDLWIASTPQVFDVALLKRAYQKHNGRPATDDAELVERLGHRVTLVQGSADNLKVTFPEDLVIAEAILDRQMKHA